MSKRFLAIVDPWAEPRPSDAIDFPSLASDIDLQCRLIHNQLPRLTPLFDDIIVINSDFKTHTIFDELSGYASVLNEYIDERTDWDMWLCGFHYGRCIHAKINEVKEQYDWGHERFHIIKNLSFMFPRDSEETILLHSTCRTVVTTKQYNWNYEKGFDKL